MKPNILFLTSILLLLTTVNGIAQSVTDDFFTNTGKIYTVLAVMVILFVILIFFLIRLESKIDKLEKRFKNE